MHDLDMGPVPKSKKPFLCEPLHTSNSAYAIASGRLQLAPIATLAIAALAIAEMRHEGGHCLAGVE
jgi:hypothetical protein